MMTTQTRPPPRQSEPNGEPSAGFRVAAILFWMGAVVVGLVGAVVIVGFVADAGTTFDLWFLVLAVPFGVLLGGAMVTTRKAKGRRGGSLAVFLLALVAAIALHGIVGLLAQQSSAQDASAACSAEELAMLEAQSFHGDIDDPPAGTQFDNCYVMLTVEGTGQQAWDDLVQLLRDNGWQLDIAWQDTNGRAYEPGIWLSQDGFRLTLWSEDFADLPLDNFGPTDDGATTFVLDIQPRT
jgi:hypothetical protein